MNQVYRSMLLMWQTLAINQGDFIMRQVHVSSGKSARFIAVKSPMRAGFLGWYSITAYPVG